MTMKRWDGAAWLDIATAKRWDGAAWIDLTVAKRWDGASWIDIPLPGGGAGGLSATSNMGSTEVSFHDGGFSPPLAKSMTTTSPVIVTATGGSGAGPTFAWTRLTGSSAISAVSPSSNSTTFQANVFLNSTRSGVWRCTVTRGAEVVHVDVSVSMTYTGTTPP